MGVGEGAGVGVGVGLDAGLGVGVAAVVEPEDALTAPPPQPTTIKRREKDSKQHMTLGPMGNDLLRSATLDATELLDVGLGFRSLQQVNFPQNKAGPARAGSKVGSPKKVLLEKFSHGRRHSRCAG